MIFWAFLGLLLKLQAAQSSDVDLCANYDDYSGFPCRIFTDCPMMANSEFVYMSTEFPCRRYVVDDPELYDHDMESFRREILARYTKTTIPEFQTVKPETKNIEPKIEKVEENVFQTTTNIPRFSTTASSTMPTTKKPTNIELQMFPDLRSPNLYDQKRESVSKKEADTPTVYFWLSIFLPIGLVLLVIFLF